MDMITVHRKAYTRKDGNYVKTTTYQIMDKSKTVETSNNKRPFNPEVKIGWPRERQADVRQAEAREAHHGEKFSASVSEQYGESFRKS